MIQKQQQKQQVIQNAHQIVQTKTLQKSAKIILLTDFPGETDQLTGELFSGTSGKELARMLHSAGIVQADCVSISVFKRRPLGGDIANWCVNKFDATGEWRASGKTGAYPVKGIAPAQYLKVKYLPLLEELYAELNNTNANIIIALGSIAAWALLDSSSVAKQRGTITTGRHIKGKKILVAHSPKSIIKNWSLRPILVADLIKASIEASTSAISFPSVEICIEPNLGDIKEFFTKYLLQAKKISIDIETDGKKIITCVGFGDCAGHAIVIPFVDRRNADFSYWHSLFAECQAWKWVQALCKLPQVKVLQNGIFDMQHLWRHGCPIYNATSDTMIKHHSQQPELQKGLGFLGSIYTNYPSWKFLRTKVKTEKPDG